MLASRPGLDFKAI